MALVKTHDACSATSIKPVLGGEMGGHRMAPSAFLKKPASCPARNAAATERCNLPLCRRGSAAVFSAGDRPERPALQRQRTRSVVDGVSGASAACASGRAGRSMTPLPEGRYSRKWCRRKWCRRKWCRGKGRRVVKIGCAWPCWHPVRPVQAGGAPMCSSRSISRHAISSRANAGSSSGSWTQISKLRVAHSSDRYMIRIAMCLA
jgi:hypothetical protein